VNVKNKLNFLVVFFILLMVGSSFATVEVAAPEVATFSKAGNGAEPGSNGEVGFSIPVGTVSGRNGFDMPVSLSYSAGIKLNQEASWVGLGFNLGFGAITRSVIGVPDDYSNGFLRSFSCPGDCKDQDYYAASFPGGAGKIIFDDDSGRTAQMANWQKTDIQCYDDAGNQCGTSMNTNGIKKWVIKTGDGTTYVFDEVAMSNEDWTRTTTAYRGFTSGWGHTDDENTDLSNYYANAWYLTAVLSSDYVDNSGLDPSNIGWAGPDNNDEGNWIKISYSDEGSYSYVYPNPRTVACTEDANFPLGGYFENVCNYEYAGIRNDEGTSNGNIALTYMSRKTNTQMLYPSVVETPISYANFNYDTESRIDGMDHSANEKQMAKLNSIDFYNSNGADTSRVVFEYADGSDELAQGAEGPGYLNEGRLTLDSIVYLGMHAGECAANLNEVNCLAEEEDTCYWSSGECRPMLPKVSFDYHGRDKPFDRYAWDWWGNYNGEVDNNNYDFVGLLGCTAGGQACYDWNNIIPIAEADENHGASSSDIDSWSVSRVDYSTGGSIEYEYELGSYSYEQDTLLGSPVPAGIRLASKTVNDGFGTGPEHSLTTQYTYGDGVTTQDLGFESKFRTDWVRHGPHIGQGITYESVTTHLPDLTHGEIKTYYRTTRDFPLTKSTCHKVLTDATNTVVNRDMFLTYSPSLSGFSYQMEYIGTDPAGVVVKRDTTTYNPFTTKADFEDTSTDPDPNEVDCNYGYHLYSKWVTAERSDSLFDGVTNTVSYTYNNENGMVQTTTTYGNDFDRRDEIQYAYEVYSGMRDDHMYSQPYMTTTTEARTGDLLAKGWTEWNNYGGATPQWRPISSHAWEDLGVEDYTQNGVDDGGAEHKLISQVISYDDYGQVLVTEDANLHRVYSYYGSSGTCGNQNPDFNNALLTCKRATVDGVNHEVKVNYDPNLYLVNSMVDLNGQVTSYGYDEFNRLMTTRLPGDDFDSVSYEYWYAENHGGISDSNPNFVKTDVVIDNPSLYSEAIANTDGLGRDYQTQAIKANDGSCLAIFQTNAYNDLGVISEKSKPYEAECAAGARANGGAFAFFNLFLPDDYKQERLEKKIDDIKKGREGRNPYYVVEQDLPLRDELDRTKLVYDHDPLARVNMVYPPGEDSPDGVFVSTEYGNIGEYRTQEVSDENLKTSTSKYDKLGNMVEFENAENEVTSYKYTPLGQMRNETDALNRISRSIYYNTLGQVARSWTLDSHITSYTYDDNGNVYEVTTPNGDIVRTHYDDLDRVDYVEGWSRWNDPFAERSWQTILQYDYDDCGYSPGYEKGKLCGVQNLQYDNEVKYYYDQKGRTIQIDEGIGDETYSTGYLYDDAGNVKTITTSADGTSNSYVYNKLGQLDQVVMPGGIDIVDYEYLETGVVDFIDYPNGVHTDYGYTCNDRDWVCGIHVRKFGGPPQTYFNEQYEYDDAGNLKTIGDYLSGVKKADFVYDDVYRLEEINNDIADGHYYDDAESGFGFDNIVYDYDEVGNRELRTVSGLTGPSDIVWDENYDYGYEGCLVGDPNCYSGSGQNNKLFQTGGIDDCEYDYDAAGNMRAKICLVDGESQRVVYEYDQNNLINSIVYSVWTQEDHYVDTGVSMSFEYDSLGRRVRKVYVTPESEIETIYSYGLGMNPLIEVTRELLES
jgi:YD repeat-containing protein